MKPVIQSLSLSLLTAVALPLTACDAEGEDEVELRVWVDVPSELPVENEVTGARDLSVILYLESLGAHHEERGWINRRMSGTIDLSDPDTLPRMLNGIRLPYGTYDALKFDESAAVVVYGGKKYPLEIRGDGFYVVTTFCVGGRGAVEDLELDWDIEGNLHYDSRSGYWLEPKLVVQSKPACDDER
jgi:hypothetical protein